MSNSDMEEIQNGDKGQEPSEVQKYNTLILYSAVLRAPAFPSSFRVLGWGCFASLLMKLKVSKHFYGLPNFIIVI